MECRDCIFWKKDYGIFCINGWSGIDRKDGYCHYEIKKIYKQEDDFCSYYKRKET